MAMTSAFAIEVNDTDRGPPEIQDAPTAVPAFIGYTERTADAVGAPLVNRPKPVSSWAEFERVFGGPAAPDIEVDATVNPDTAAVNVKVSPPRVAFLLAHAVQHYFANGGQQCVVVSVGGYATGAVALGDTQTGLLGGLQALQLTHGITLIVIPEMVMLDDAGYSKLAQDTLQHCAELQDRFAILDVRQGDQAKTPARLASDRALFGPANARLGYGAAYYPWLRTTLHHAMAADDTRVLVRLQGAAAVPLATLRLSQAAVYSAAKASLRAQTVVLPPSAAIAGAYATTDRERGVWSAPANRTLHEVLEPMVPLSTQHTEPLLQDGVGGKSINVVRSIPGRGVMVWGARTLAGNDSEWRYVPVRRFVSTVQANIKLGAAWVAFEPNDAPTRASLVRQVETYLSTKLRSGAFQGKKPEQAYYVRCGLGQTMTPADVKAGRIQLELGMALLRPAEFIILKLTLATMQA
jgi:uncharacterized protein